MTRSVEPSRRAHFGKRGQAVGLEAWAEMRVVVGGATRPRRQISGLKKETAAASSSTNCQEGTWGPSMLQKAALAFAPAASQPSERAAIE